MSVNIQIDKLPKQTRIGDVPCGKWCVVGGHDSTSVFLKVGQDLPPKPTHARVIHLGADARSGGEAIIVTVSTDMLVQVVSEIHIDVKARL